jgi:hypothetical protein
MGETRHCPKCETEFQDDDIEKGLCPACLVGLALSDRLFPGEDVTRPGTQSGAPRRQDLTQAEDRVAVELPSRSRARFRP